MALSADSNDRWLDEDGIEYQAVSYRFALLDGRGYVLYAHFSNGAKLPVYELKSKYKKIGLSYIGNDKKKNLLNE